MMEELDLLKKDWKKNENSFEQITENEIYNMIHKKSSSIVKWILIISVIEFLFWILITFLFCDDKYQEKLERYGIDGFVTTINTLNYIVIVVFIYVFYKNYKSIFTTDSTKQLMKNILKTRKTVQGYIWYNLGMATLTIIVNLVIMFNHNRELILLTEKASTEGHKGFFVLCYIGISILLFALIIGIFWLFYKLLYGVLLKKLFRNYKELEKIDL